MDRIEIDAGSCPGPASLSFGYEAVNCLSQSPYGILSTHEEVDMITLETLTDYIRRMMPDAIVSMVDRTGTMDHLKVTVVSDAFRGRNLLDRHRMIYQALDDPMKDGRIHALELTARTMDESGT
jgi:stress-induced morphogen